MVPIASGESLPRAGLVCFTGILEARLDSPTGGLPVDARSWWGCPGCRCARWTPCTKDSRSTGISTCTTRQRARCPAPNADDRPHGPGIALRRNACAYVRGEAGSGGLPFGQNLYLPAGTSTLTVTAGGPNGRPSQTFLSTIPDGWPQRRVEPEVCASDPSGESRGSSVAAAGTLIVQRSGDKRTRGVE